MDKIKSTTKLQPAKDGGVIQKQSKSKAAPSKTSKQTSTTKVKAATIKKAVTDKVKTLSIKQSTNDLVKTASNNDGINEVTTLRKKQSLIDKIKAIFKKQPLPSGDQQGESLPKKKRVRTFSRSTLGIPYGVFMALFIVLPLIILVLYAFSESSSDGSLTFKFTFENFATALSKENIMVFGRSFGIGILTTLICFGIGYPTAYFLANKKFNKSAILVLLFVLPMWINFLLRTLATKSLFNFLNIELGFGAVVFGMVYNFLPFMILPIYTTIQKIDGSLMEAASDLGASQTTTFFKVVFPLSLPGVLSGFTMVFTPTITTFVVSDMLSNNKITLIGNFINLHINHLQYGVASAISLLALLFIGATMLVVNRYDKSNSAAGGGLW